MATGDGTEGEQEEKRCTRKCNNCSYICVVVACPYANVYVIIPLQIICLLCNTTVTKNVRHDIYTVTGNAVQEKIAMNATDSTCT